MIRQNRKEIGKNRVFGFYEYKNMILKYLATCATQKLARKYLYSFSLEQLHKARRHSKVFLRETCTLTGRRRGIHCQYGLSRISLKELVSFGMLPGLSNSNW